jgi:hypothetical protein
VLGTHRGGVSGRRSPCQHAICKPRSLAREHGLSEECIAGIEESFRPGTPERAPSISYRQAALAVEPPDQRLPLFQIIGYLRRRELTETKPTFGRLNVVLRVPQAS